MAVVWLKRRLAHGRVSMSAEPPETPEAMAWRQAVMVRRPSPDRPTTYTRAGTWPRSATTAPSAVRREGRATGATTSTSTCTAGGSMPSERVASSAWPGSAPIIKVMSICGPPGENAVRHLRPATLRTAVIQSGNGPHSARSGAMRQLGPRVLDHGLPPLPAVLGDGEVVPVARWAGTRFGAVLHVCRHPYASGSRRSVGRRRTSFCFWSTFPRPLATG